VNLFLKLILKIFVTLKKHFSTIRLNLGFFQTVWYFVFVDVLHFVRFEHQMKMTYTIYLYI